MTERILLGIWWDANVKRVPGSDNHSSRRTAEFVSTQSRRAADAARTVAPADQARMAQAPPVPASAWRCGGAGHARAATAAPAPVSGKTESLRPGALRLRDGKIAFRHLAIDPGKPSRPTPGAASVGAVSCAQRWEWRRRGRARSPVGGSMADGMAGTHVYAPVARLSIKFALTDNDHIDTDVHRTTRFHRARWVGRPNALLGHGRLDPS